MKPAISAKLSQRFVDHEELMERVKKTLYYGELPKTECLSLPVTEVAVELFSKTGLLDTLDRLDVGHAAHISSEACVSPCSLMLAVLYLDRLKNCNPQYLQKVSQSELFLVTLMIASKFMYDSGEDDTVFNDMWASSAGMDMTDTNHLEKEFLTAIDWRVFVDKKAFLEILTLFEGRIAWQEATRRGWFTYTDLAILMNTVNPEACWNVFSENILKATVGCVAFYAASFLTLLGSVFIVAHSPMSQHSFKDSITLMSSSCDQGSEPQNETSHLAPAVNSTHTASLVDVLTTGMILASLGTSADMEDDASNKDEMQHCGNKALSDDDEVVNISVFHCTRERHYYSDYLGLSWLYDIPVESSSISATWTQRVWLAMWSIMQFTGGGDITEFQDTVDTRTGSDKAVMPSVCLGVVCSLFGENGTSVVMDDEQITNECRPIVNTVTQQL